MPQPTGGGPSRPAIGSCLCELRAHDHLCLIYESREEQLEALVPFLRHGLEEGDRCFYVADARTVTDVAPALRAGGVDVEGEVARGAFTLATERETYLAGGQFDPDAMLDMAVAATRQAVGAGYGGLRIAGEMSWALGDQTKLERLMQYEVKVNERITTVPAMAVCQYDRRRFAPDVIRDVIRTHPLIAVGGRVCRNFYYVPPGQLVGPDRLAHEVDRLLENILEREQAEDALRESERRLALAGRLAAVGTLVAGIAHEINNPLAYVTANLRYVAERLPAPQGDRVAEALQQALAEALDGAQRVAEVVQGLRRFAGPAGEARRGPVDVGAEIDAAVAIARHEVVGRARLGVEVASSLPPVVAGPHEIGQVVVNLLVNAAQAIPEGQAGQGEVKLSARAEGARVVVEVADTGAGIPAELLPRIFDPFFTTKPVGAGTGLGLAICHGIVSRAGGTIAARSALGRGTVVRVELPAAPVAAPAPAPPPRSAAARRHRVLVVDDEPLVGRALARMLRDHDVEVITLASEAARRVEAGERWDVVLCDLIMPDLSGMELAERIERVAPDLARRLVFTTGGAYTDASRAFLEGPGRRHLQKPFDVEVLRETVREVAGTG